MFAMKSLKSTSGGLEMAPNFVACCEEKFVSSVKTEAVFWVHLGHFMVTDEHHVKWSDFNLKPGTTHWFWLGFALHYWVYRKPNSEGEPTQTKDEEKICMGSLQTETAPFDEICPSWPCNDLPTKMLRSGHMVDGAEARIQGF